MSTKTKSIVAGALFFVGTRIAGGVLAAVGMTLGTIVVAKIADKYFDGKGKQDNNKPSEEPKEEKEEV